MGAQEPAGAALGGAFGERFRVGAGEQVRGVLGELGERGDGRGAGVGEVVAPGTVGTPGQPGVGEGGVEGVEGVGGRPGAAGPGREAGPQRLPEGAEPAGPPPQRFEAGVPVAARAVGLAAAVEYLERLGMAEVAAYEETLTARALQLLAEVPGARVVGPADRTDRGSAVSFTVDGIHPHDVGQVLDERGVAVRVGHHRARPIVKRYGIPATTRASFYVSNILEEVDALVEGVRAAQGYFGG